MRAYFDHNATSPLDERVLEQMLPWLKRHQGNPSSSHSGGRKARAAIELARSQVAQLVNADAADVIFTSGGTESNNLAIKGQAKPGLNGRILVSAIEHPSVLEAANALKAKGWVVGQIASDAAGVIQPDALRELVSPGLNLVSIMLANNETGVIQPIEILAEIATQAGAMMHTDAVQMAGKMPIDKRQLGVSMLSLSAHKFGGPQGVGALVSDRSVELNPQQLGGGQERGLRSGTENIAAIIGFGAAAVLAFAEQEQRTEYLQGLRNSLERGLGALDQVQIHAQQATRLPNTLMIGVANLESETLLMLLDQQGFEVSASSACGTARMEPSHVLSAMGLSLEVARNSIRISLGLENTQEQIDEFLRTLAALLELASVNVAGHV